MRRLAAAFMTLLATLSLAGPVLAQAEFLSKKGTGVLTALGFAVREVGPGPSIQLGVASSSRVNFGFQAAYFNSHPKASAYSIGAEVLVLKGRGARRVSVGVGGTAEVLNVMEGKEVTQQSLQLSLINNLASTNRIVVQSVLTLAYITAETHSRSGAIQLSIPIVLWPKSGHSPYFAVSAAANNREWVIAVRVGVLLLWPNARFFEY